jgi:hypothetical protein
MGKGKEEECGMKGEIQRLIGWSERIFRMCGRGIRT